MKRLIASTFGFVAVMAVWASMAQAVTYSYCHSSLRGGGSLAPDPDVYQYANAVNAQAMYHDHWEGANGAYTVYEVIRFYRGADVWTRRFYCSGSGSTYSDGRAF